MDEYDRGMDPEVKRYFKQIVNSFSVGAMWMILVVMLGLFLGLGVVRRELRWYNIAFYIFFIITFAAFIYFLYKVWRKPTTKS